MSLNNNSSNGHLKSGISMSELKTMDMDINCSNNSSMDQMDQIQQQSENNSVDCQFRVHAALTRTISTPQPQLKQHHLNQFHSQQQPQHLQSQQDSNALVSTLIENLSNINLHRKLERTQSEPLPQQQQVNTSR